MRLLVFLTKGFETIEFSVFIDVMGWARTDFGCKVDVATCGLNRRVVSSFNVPVMVDKTIDEVSADAQKKWIATVCVAALPVGKSGVLKGRKATTYHLRGAHKQKVLQDFGAIVVNEPIVVDDNIITSYCPQTSYGVAFLLLEKLTSYHEMCLVKEAMAF